MVHIMRIAVLADIHGNLVALESVLSNVKESNVDQIILLGDLITGFPNETNSILDLLKMTTDFIIKGNREHYILNMNEESFNYDQFKPLVQTYNIITNRNYEYISKLPEQISILYSEQLSLKCVHGSPFSMFDKIEENNTEIIEKSIRNINEKILLCGQLIYNGIKNSME